MPPLAIAAGIGAAGSIAGGAMQSSAAKDAAASQAAAADRATQLQEKMYNQTRADQEPWRAAGSQALTGMQSADFQRDFGASDFQQDPGYAFRMQEGQKALERSAAAKGGLQGGAFGKALSRYGQDFASNEYGNAYNRFNQDRDRRFSRLSNVANMGIGANTALANAGNSYASNTGNIAMDSANSQGASRIAGANAMGGMISNLGNIGMNTLAMSQQPTWMDKQTSAMPSIYGMQRTQ